VVVYLRARRGGGLDRDVADAAAAAVDETALGRFEAGVVDERAPRRHADERDAGGLADADAVRQRGDSVRRRGGVLGAGPLPVVAEAGAEHAVAFRELLDAVADGRHFAREVRPGDHREFGGLVRPVAEVDVDGVHRRRVHSDEDLVSSRFRPLYALVDLQYAPAAVFVVANCAHSRGSVGEPDKRVRTGQRVERQGSGRGERRTALLLDDVRVGRGPLHGRDALPRVPLVGVPLPAVGDDVAVAVAESPAVLALAVLVHVALLSDGVGPRGTGRGRRHRFVRDGGEQEGGDDLDADAERVAGEDDRTQVARVDVPVARVGEQEADRRQEADRQPQIRDPRRSLPQGQDGDEPVRQHRQRQRADGERERPVVQNADVPFVAVVERRKSANPTTSNTDSTTNDQ
jgi:hypothetical protein